MKKKYTKPELKKILSPKKPRIAGPPYTVINGIPFDLTAMHNSHNTWKPPEGVQDNNIRFNPPSILPEMIIDGTARCPMCKTTPVAMVGVARINGSTLTKNKCLVCGHVWGP